MAVCFFLPETGAFIFYIFAAVLLFSSSSSTQIKGWYLLFFTHLLLTAKIALDLYGHGSESFLFLLLACMVFVLVCLFMTLITIGRAKPPDYVEGAGSPPIRGEVRKQLNRTRRLVLADVALLALLVLFSQMRITWPAAIPHLFPLNRQQFRMGAAVGSGVVYRWQWVSLREYTFLSGFALPWVSGGGMAAALGLSSYLVYWSRDVLLRLGGA